MPEKSRIFFYSLLALFLSATVLHFQYFIGHDGVWYARMAQNLFAGKGIAVNPGEPYFDHPPFYPFLIGCANLLFKDLEFSGHWVSTMAFALTVIPFFYLARSIYPENSADWASLLYATNGFLLIHSNMVLAESVFIFFIVMQIYLVHLTFQNDGNSTRMGILIGLVAGLAYLIRPEGLIFYSAGLSAILLLDPKPFARRLHVILISLPVFLLCYLPYLAWIHQVTHKWQMSAAITEIFVKRQMDLSYPAGYLEAKKIYQGLTEDKTRLKLDELKENFSLRNYFRKDRFVMIRAGLSSIPWRFLEFNKYFYGGLGVFFAGAGWLSVPWDARRKRSEFMFLIFLSTVFPQFFGIFHPKRYLLYYPIFLIWVGEGVEIFRRWFRESFHQGERASRVAAFAMCLFLSLPSAVYIRHCLAEAPMPLEYKTLGIWMKQNLPHLEEERVASRHPSVIYYSGAEILHPPYLPYVEKFDNLLIYLKSQRTKYFVAGNDLEDPTFDAYRFLLDETQPPPRGTLRRHVVQGRIKLILYEVL